MQLEEGDGGAPVCSMVPASVGRSDAVQVQIIFNFFRGIKVSIVDSSSKTARFVDEMSLVGIDACDCLPDCESTEYQYALTSSSLRWNVLRELLHREKTLRSCDSRNLNLEPLCTLEDGPTPKLWLDKVY